MKVNVPEDEYLRESLQALARDKTLGKTFVNGLMRTYNDVLGSYYSACYRFGDYWALIGSDTFIDFINENRMGNGAGRYFDRLDDVVWSSGILEINILLGLDSREKKHRSTKDLSDGLSILSISGMPQLNVTEAEEKLLKDYRNNRIAHWNYRDPRVKNIDYLLPVELLNKIRNYIVEVYFIITNGAAIELPTVKERALKASRAVAGLFDYKNDTKRIAHDLGFIPEVKWMMPNGGGLI